MKYARIKNDRIVDLATDPASQFHPDLAAEFEAVPDEVERGWVRDEAGDWSSPPPPPPPPAPEPKPRDLTRVEFVRLCMGAGGMTLEQLVQAKAAPELAAMWIMLEMAEKVAKDDPEIEPGLAELAALGHLPNGAQAVLDAWPNA